MSARGEELPGIFSEDEELIDLNDDSTVVGSEVPDLEPEEAEGGEDETKHETARETVARVLKEQTATVQGGDASGQTKNKNTNANEKNVVAPAQEDAPPPPERLTVEQKQVYNKAPAELKRAIADLVKNHEAVFTKVTTKAQEEAKESSALREAVRPYFLSNPALQERGFTESGFVSALVAHHQKINDPKTSFDTYLNLGKSLGFDVSGLEAERPAQPSIDITQHPEFRALQEKLNSVTSVIDGQRNKAFNEVLEKNVSDMKTVSDMVDANGNYLYPELQDAAFLEKAKPLVIGLVRSAPELTYGQALLRAYSALKGVPIESHQGAPARLPEQNNQNNLDRAARAAVSVRGKTSAPKFSGDLENFPPEALGSARDTVKWAMQQLKGR